MSTQMIQLESANLTIDVDRPAENEWHASTIYEGELIEAVADTKRGAISALLVAMRSELDSAPSDSEIVC